MNPATSAFFSHSYEYLTARYEDFFNQPIIKLFMQQQANRDSFFAAVKHPSSSKIHQLNERFEWFYYRVRIQKYVCSLIRFYSIDFDKRERKRRERYPAVLDKPGLTGNIPEPPQAERSFRRPLEYGDGLASYLNDDCLIRAVKKLTPKQQAVLVYYYVHGYSNKEIASFYRETPQNISSIRRQALVKIKKLYLPDQEGRKEPDYAR